MIERALEKIVRAKLNAQKAIVLLGARQVGKTTLLKRIFSENKNVLWLNGDEKDIQDLFLNASSSRLKAFFGKKRTVIIDEAQRIPDIGQIGRAHV